MSTERLQNAIQAYRAHCDGIKSVIIGSVDAQGVPLASYAPYVMDEKKNIFIMLSGLSSHTRNLETKAKASALFIEDEGRAQNIFARKRLTFDCSVSILDPAGDDFDKIADLMYERHGTIIERMRLQPDFRIFQLSPESGRFVIGFGAAYDVTGEHLDELKHLSADGINPHASRNPHALGGHGRDERSSKRLPAVPRGSLSDGMKKMIVSNMNEHHKEGLMNIAKVFADEPDALEVEMMDIDKNGIVLHITKDTGGKQIQVSFDEPVTSAEVAQSTLMNMSMKAKQNLQD